MNVGGPDYADPSSQIWLDDGDFTDQGAPGTVSAAIRGTELDAMYQTRRYGTPEQTPVTFELPVGDADLYTVRLHFAEAGGEVTGAGQRIFDVLVDDALWIRDLDVYAMVGNRRAFQKSLSVYVGGGRFSIQLIPKRGRPMLSGIEVWRASDATVEGSPGAPRIVGCGRRCR